jgi:hypothetical protein
MRSFKIFLQFNLRIPTYMQVFIAIQCKEKEQKQNYKKMSEKPISCESSTIFASFLFHYAQAIGISFA